MRTAHAKWLKSFMLTTAQGPFAAAAPAGEMGGRCTGTAGEPGSRCRHGGVGGDPQRAGQVTCSLRMSCTAAATCVLPLSV